jgi:hypothetical protein
MLSLSKTYISDSLRSAMDAADDPKAVFRCIVDLPITIEDCAAAEEQLGPNPPSAPQDDRNPNASEKGDHEPTRVVSEYELATQGIYHAIVGKRMEFAKTIGAGNVESVEHSSGVTALYYEAYFMELTADMIDRMAKDGGYVFRLAPPKRSEGFSGKISDALTNVLEDSSDSETFAVVVVCAIDRWNSFATVRSLTRNPDYNSDLWHPFSGSDLSDEGVTSYINEIIERNSLLDKIRNSNPDDAHYGMDAKYNSDYSLAVGFEAELTKREIMDLVSDAEVKVIYYTGYQNPSQYMDD